MQIFCNLHHYFNPHVSPSLWVSGVCHTFEFHQLQRPHQRAATARTYPQSGYILVLVPSRSSARLGLVLARAFGKESSARLSSPCLPKSSARLAISCKKKLGSARLTLSFNRPSYLEKQKMS